MLRIVGSPRYPNSPGSPAVVAGVLHGLRRLPGHTFWSDDISLLDSSGADDQQVVASGQVTDSYLLAVAAAHGGQLATFDRKLSTAAIRDGSRYLVVI